MTSNNEPVAMIEPHFSSDGASATAWAEARGQLENAEVYWLSTVRSDGRPHVTPLLSVWVDDALYFCTGATERKARNLAQNSHCILTTGCNTRNNGLDLVVEGEAAQLRDDTRLQRVADAYESKYGSEWRFTIRDGAFHHDPDSLRGADTGEAVVYEVTPTTVFGFGKGNTYSQTRWRF
jgi:nitroimidazol reductase NimA-like FMN-containing flavoprotein (pyridoxamine 5'-phosphate oxidase superfamily)